MAFISASILFSACEVPKENNSIIAEEKEVAINRPEDLEDIERSEGKIFFTSISAKNEYILLKNGVGIDFNLSFLPFNATEDVIIEIKDENIVNFGSEISSEEQSNFLNFTTAGNFIYPLNVGETEIVITAPKDETENLKIISKIIVLENEEDLDIHIFDINGNEINELRSGIKANGERESYTARVTSFKSLQNKLNILNSEGLILEENSIIYYQEDNKSLCDFDFYLNSEDNWLQVSRKESYSNSDEIIFSKKVVMNSTNYINGLKINISRFDNKEPIISDGNYIMYLTDDDLMQSADQNGYFNNYIINVLDLDGNKFENFEITYAPNSVINFSDKDGINSVFVNELGNVEVTITALDGSGYLSKINFTVEKIQPTSVKIGDVELLSDFKTADLENEIGKEISIYTINNLAKTDSFTLSFLIDNAFISNSYISLENDLGISISEQISQNEEGVLKEFTFKSENEGQYIINIIIDDVKIYSFTINVLSSENHMEFSTRDTDENIVYSLIGENKTITILDLNKFKGDIIFKCLTRDADGLNQPQDLKIEYDKTICFIQSLEQICISDFKEIKEFMIKITEVNSGISEEITIIFN